MTVFVLIEEPLQYDWCTNSRVGLCEDVGDVLV